MKFLRVLANSLISGLFLGALFSVLIYDLNINLPFQFLFFGQLVLFNFLTYGLLVTVVCVVIFFIVQFFSGKRIRLKFASPSFLSVSFSFLIFLFVAIFRDNRDYFSSLFDTPTRAALNTQITVLVILGILGLLAFYGFHRLKKNPLVYVVFYALLGAGLAFVLGSRLNYSQPQKTPRTSSLEAKKLEKRVVVLGMEGMSLDLLIPMISEGKLPNFSWLFEEGSWGNLVSFSPNEPFILNESLSTGKLPAKHRQLSLSNYAIFTGRNELEVVPRHILFKQLRRLGLLAVTPARPVPVVKDIWTIFADNGSDCLRRDWPYGLEAESADPKAQKAFQQFFKDIGTKKKTPVDRVRKAFLTDWHYEERAFQEKNQAGGRLFCLLLNGLNATEVYFYKYSYPDLFGNIAQDDINAYGGVIEKYYQYYDQIIGKYLAALKDDELLVIYSSHGTEPLPSWKRFVEWILGNPDVSAYHENAPDGVVFFYGKGVNRGTNVQGMKLVDIAPTLLYYLGLPVALDMDGTVKSALFQREFTWENPVYPISSYEDVKIKK